MNVQRAFVSRFQVQQIQRAELLVDDGISRDGRRLDVEPVVFHHLLDLLRLHVIRKQRNGAVSIREKVNRVPDPHRVKIIRIVSGNGGLHAGVGKIDDPDGLGLPAAIALPGALPLDVRHIGDARSFRRERRLRSSDQGHLRRVSAFDRNSK